MVDKVHANGQKNGLVTEKHISGFFPPFSGLFEYFRDTNMPARGVDKGQRGGKYRE